MHHHKPLPHHLHYAVRSVLTFVCGIGLELGWNFSCSSRFSSRSILFCLNCWIELLSDVYVHLNIRGMRLSWRTIEDNYVPFSQEHCTATRRTRKQHNKEQHEMRGNSVHFWRNDHKSIKQNNQPKIQTDY